MASSRARLRVLGYGLAAGDAVAALALVMQPSDIGDLKIEATLIIIVLAAVASWLILVE